MAGTAGVEQRIRAAFADGEVDRVAVLKYGDDPEIGPGETAIRVFLNLAETGRGRAAHESLVAFRDTHRPVFDKLRQELRSRAWWIEYRPTGEIRPGDPSFRSLLKDEQDELGAPGELTPVMTRLGAADLATVDTLIAAGIATSRAEVLRWAVGRIRENPAFDQLRDRIQEIEELRAKF
jgi:hypothetical protein